jgi:hypothetical protein
MCPLGPLSTRAPKTLSSGLASQRWCRQTSPMVCLARTLVRSFSTSLSCATPLSQKTSHQQASDSVCFPSSLRGRRSSGFIRTRKLSTHGTNVQWRSSWSTSPWAKPMPWGGEFQTSSRIQWNLSLRRGKASGYIQACPHHGIENWLVLQNFYEGLTPMSKGHVDAATRGAFLSLTIAGATTLIEKMVSNQSWGKKENNKKACIPWRRRICLPQKWTFS